MKKILLIISILFLMSGCGEETEMISCSSTNTANGVTTKTKYDIDYIDDEVKYVTITYDYKQDSTDDTDGLDADSDGIDENTDTDNDTGSVSSDEVIDGAVGDAIDGVVSSVTETILDIAGIKNTYENQLSVYDGMEGFSYKVDVDSDNEYKIIYEIDMDKISDDDLANFNINRSYSTLISTYEGSGYTCE